MNERFPTVGIIGAGQLARMTVAPAAALGVNLLLFAESAQDSAAQIAPHVIGDFRDLEAVKEFAKRCDVITFEHELIPLSVIKGLEAAGVKVFPTSDSFQYSQNKALMRERLSKYPAPKWKVIQDGGDVFDFEIAVMVARSAHSQAVTWAPTQTIKSLLITMLSR